MRVRAVGWSALLVECADAAEVEACRAELGRMRAAGELTATEIVPGATSVLVDGVTGPDALANWTPVLDAAPVEEQDRVVEVPTRYDGPDLELVAEHWGTSTEAVVARHVDTEFRVAFCGFAPGFGYLTGLPPELSVPRLPTPRPAVPAGSVGLAGPYTGVYPTSSPGGWLLIGRTDTVRFDPGTDPPTPLTPGARVRFRRA